MIAGRQKEGRKNEESGKIGGCSGRGAARPPLFGAADPAGNGPGGLVPRPARRRIDRCVRAAGSLPVAPTNHIAGNEDKLDAALDEICQQYGVKACSVAAFEGEQIVYTHSYGKARGDTPADENTKYRVASISKTVTAMLAMHLVDEGKLSLDMDIADIHPDLQNPYYPDSTTTLEMLLTHTSGIVDGAGYNWAISQSVFPSLDQVLQYSNFSAAPPANSTPTPTSAWGWSAPPSSTPPGSPSAAMPSRSCLSRWDWTPVSSPTTSTTHRPSRCWGQSTRWIGARWKRPTPASRSGRCTCWDRASCTSRQRTSPASR